ncbi:MFS transporter [Candidatus Bathyarchaeota archaeon]|nr:MFS transporter [Candidatus Bathyarchaeota archaeon]
MKPNLIKFLTLAAIMASWTYIPIFAKDLGIPNTEIGFIAAFYALTLSLSFFIFGRASDKYGRKLFLLAGLASSAIAFFLQIFAQDFLTLLTTRALVGFCFGIYPASLVAYVDEKKKDLSKFSSFGAFGWALGSLIAGLIAVYFTIKGIFIFGSLLFFIAFLTALKMRFGRHDSIGVPKFPIRIIKKNRSLYLSILIRHIGAHVMWTFWPLFLQSLGADLFLVGAIVMINSIAQFIFMYTLSGRINYTSSITAGLILSGIAFFSFTLATDFWQIIPIQILLGASWALIYVGGLRYLMDRNVEKATVSGLLDSVLSLSCIIGPLIATFVITTGGYRTTMYLASILAFISFLLFKFSK